ncbi:MAG: UDP-3-O-acyl-N-acetylglucosamine deacetylase [Holosporales bacterium]|jgi:UDP-3-O-[3-hydroxymyristoyl] N-acetylglucosamine deacetylase|nr:UDP-3-O-acyl-N-acetylglucosamine deacetylase [Holosporales bacterium]
MSTKLRSEATVGAAVSFEGIGVHGGNRASIRILPAPDNLGVVFKRTDISGKNPYISLSPEAVVSPDLCTRITNNDGITISVIEHLLAAFRITGITNALVEVDSDEIPIMDGSAKEFVDGIKEVGTIRQRPSVPAILIKKDVVVECQTGRIIIRPARKYHVAVKLDYARINPVIGKYNRYSFDSEDDLIELSRARTFGWSEDWEVVRSRGFGLGASEENTVGIGPGNEILNTGGLRYPTELAAHKCLDLLGDLFILGCDIIGKIECLNPSHALNNALLKTLMLELEDHELIMEREQYKSASECFSRASLVL